MNSKSFIPIVFPEVIYNCGWLEEINEITNENIRMISNIDDEIFLYSDFPGWKGFVFLNFSVN